MGQGFPNPRQGINVSAGGGLAKTGTVVFSNSNGVTFGTQASASSTVITISVAAGAGFGGIAAGTQTATSGTITLSNSNGITFGMSNSNVITASFVAIVGIAAGTQTATSGTIAFSNSNGISFGMSNSNAITASFAAITAISGSGGNITSGGVSFAASNGITFGVNGQTVTAAMPTVRWFKPPHDQQGSNLMAANSGAINLSLQRISVPFQISATRLDLLGHLTVVGSTAGSLTLSAAIYTFNASTASSASSSSSGYTWNATTTASASSNYPGVSGTRWRSMPIGTWNLTPGEYLIALMGSLNGPAGTTGSMTLFGQSSVSVVAALGGGNMSDYFCDGIFSAGTGAFPSSIHLSAINQTGSAVQGQPYFRLVGTF